MNALGVLSVLADLGEGDLCRDWGAVIAASRSCLGTMLTVAPIPRGAPSWGFYAF